MPPLIYFTATFATYGAALVSGIGQVYEILFIPSLQYLNMFLAWLLLYFLLWIEDRIAVSEQETGGVPNVGGSVGWVMAVLVSYVTMVLISHLMRSVPVPFLILMEVFALIFLLIACCTYMFHKRLLGPFKRIAPASPPEGVDNEASTVSEERF